jgi:hypothetical protein
VTLTTSIHEAINTEWILPVNHRCVKAFINQHCAGSSFTFTNKPLVLLRNIHQIMSIHILSRYEKREETEPSLIVECSRCLNGTGLRFFLPYFGEESLMPNLCVSAGLLRRADLETMIFGSYVCSAIPFTDEELIQDCVSSHLPFAYSPLRLVRCGTGMWWYRVD